MRGPSLARFDDGPSGEKLPSQEGIRRWPTSDEDSASYDGEGDPGLTAVSQGIDAHDDR